MAGSSRRGTSSQKEAKSYPKISQWILESYPTAWIYRTTDRFRAGIPDFLFCAGGRLVGIEVKREGKEPRLLQEYELKKILEAGGRSFVAYGHSFTEQVTLKELLEDETEKSIVYLGRGAERQDRDSQEGTVPVHSDQDKPGDHNRRSRITKARQPHVQDHLRDG